MVTLGLMPERLAVAGNNVDLVQVYPRFAYGTGKLPPQGKVEVANLGQRSTRIYLVRTAQAEDLSPKVWVHRHLGVR